MISMDKKYKYRNGGPARILCVDANGICPVISLNSSGEVVFHSTSGCMTQLDEFEWDLIESSKYDGFKDGDEVICWDDLEIIHRLKRHFAYEKDGVAWCYANGHSKWTSDGTLTCWDNCVLASEFDGD